MLVASMARSPNVIDRDSHRLARRRRLLTPFAACRVASGGGGPLGSLILREDDLGRLAADFQEQTFDLSDRAEIVIHDLELQRSLMLHEDAPFQYRTI
jgi:hypothetical protein